MALSVVSQRLKKRWRLPDNLPPLLHRKSGDFVVAVKKIFFLVGCHVLKLAVDVVMVLVVVDIVAVVGLVVKESLFSDRKVNRGMFGSCLVCLVMEQHRVYRKHTNHLRRVTRVVSLLFLACWQLSLSVCQRQKGKQVDLSISFALLRI